MSKHVLHVTSSTQLGGLERRLEMLEEAKDTRFFFEYVTIGDSSLYKTTISNDKIISMPVAASRCRFFSLNKMFWLYSLIKSKKSPIVHAHGYRAVLHVIPAAFFARSKIRIAEFVGISPFSIKAKAAIYPALFLSTKVLGISEIAGEYLKKSFGLLRCKINYVNNPVKLREYSAAKGSSSKVFRICFVGRLESVKNPVLLVKVFSNFLKIAPNAELWIVGDGALMDDLKECIKDNGVLNSVRLFGHVARPENYIAMCNLYVQPSESEAFGIAIVEAMMLGVPPVVTKNTGASCAVKHRINGWIVDCPLDKSLFNAMLEAYSIGPDRLQVMGRCAKEYTRTEFSVKNYLDRLYSLYSP